MLSHSRGQQGLLGTLISATALASAVACSPLSAQETPSPASVEILRGRVITADSQPVIGASVHIRDIGNTQQREVRTDRQGSYTVLFPGRAGDYVISIQAMGLRPAVIRVVRWRPEDEVLTGNVTMERLSAAPTQVAPDEPPRQLDSVRVRGGRGDRPRTSAALRGTNIGVAEGSGTVDPATVGVPLSDAFDRMNPAMYSILGADPSENRLSVNGMQVDAILPDAGVPRMLSHTADPSIGGYSGGNLDVFFNNGGTRTLRSLGIQWAPNPLQVTDPANRYGGTNSASVALTFAMSGPVLAGRLNQNSSFALRRHTTVRPQFPTTDGGLYQLGLAADSLDRFLNFLENTGIPRALPSLPTAQRSTQLAWMTRLDKGGATGSNTSLMINVGTNKQEGLAMTPSAVPAYGGSSHTTSGFLSFNTGRYVGNGFFTKVTALVNPTVSASRPYFSFPAARVRVVSDFADSSETRVAWLNFGGNPSLHDETRKLNAELRFSTSWLSYSGRHRYELTGAVRASSFRSVRPLNPFGTFEFESLEGLWAGHAARFTRQLSTDTRRASARNLMISIGDRWSPSNALSLHYGLRLEHDHVSTPARYNPVVDSVFHYRTDKLPSRTALSPTLSLSWQYSAWREIVDSARGRTINILPGRLSFTVARLQSLLRTERIAMIAEATGLPSGVQRLECVGSAVPLAAWDEYRRDISQVPTSCVGGGGGGSAFVGLPRVQVFDPAYQSPTEWRARLVIQENRLFRIPIMVCSPDFGPAGLTFWR